MKARTVGKIRMLRTLTDFLDETQETWGDHKAFSKASAEIGTLVAAILATAQQRESRSGATAAKSQALVLLGEAANEVAGAVVACATADGDSDLARSMDYSKSDITKGREVSVIGRCREIHAAAQKNREALADYGVTSQKLSAFNKRIEAFDALLTKPRKDKAHTAAATRAQPKLMRQVDTLLRKRLDKLVVQFEASNPEFVSKYRMARFIVKSGGSRGETTLADTLTAVATSSPALPQRDTRKLAVSSWVNPPRVPGTAPCEPQTCIRQVRPTHGRSGAVAEDSHRLLLLGLGNTPYCTRLLDSLSLSRHGESSRGPRSVMILDPTFGNSLWKVPVCRTVKHHYEQ